jgi:hypothetical protein
MFMKNEEELESIIRQKDFAALTGEERELVLQTIGSEEEYETIRKIELAVSGEKLRSTLEPHAQTLRALQQRMKKHSGSFEWSDIFQVKVPAYVAVLAALAISVIIFSLRSSSPAERLSLKRANVPLTRVDTVYITKTDTVIRERIVYRQVNQSRQVSIPLKSTPEAPVHQRQPSAAGFSMKEKEELNKLLVSGSD